MTKSKRLYESLTEEQFESVLKKAVRPIHKICFILAYGAGLRISEIPALEKHDFDFERGTLFIRQAKSDKYRVVNIPRLFEQEHLAFIPIKLTERAIRKAFLTASLRAGVNTVLYTDASQRPRYRYKFHSLRQSYATRALEKGVPINELQALLGHENLATTSMYTKANPMDAIASIMDKEV